MGLCCTILLSSLHDHFDCRIVKKRAKQRGKTIILYLATTIIRVPEMINARTGCAAEHRALLVRGVVDLDV